MHIAIAHKFRAEYLWQGYFNFIVQKYFFKGIYNQLCTRAIGKLALKRLWVHYFEANAFCMDAESEKEAMLFEEVRGNQEIKDYYDLVLK